MPGIHKEENLPTKETLQTDQHIFNLGRVRGVTIMGGREVGGGIIFEALGPFSRKKYMNIISPFYLCQS